MTLFTVSQRKLPSFAEFDVETSENEAVDRLTAIQIGPLDSLGQ